MAKTPLRRFQFSLRSLLLLTAAVSVGLAWWVSRDRIPNDWELATIYEAAAHSTVDESYELAHFLDSLGSYDIEAVGTAYDADWLKGRTFADELKVGKTINAIIELGSIARQWAENRVDDANKWIKILDELSR